jgi:hypothetical protein
MKSGWLWEGLGLSSHRAVEFCCSCRRLSLLPKQLPDSMLHAIDILNRFACQSHSLRIYDLKWKKRAKQQRGDELANLVGHPCTHDPE